MQSQQNINRRPNSLNNRDQRSFAARFCQCFRRNKNNHQKDQNQQSQLNQLNQQTEPPNTGSNLNNASTQQMNSSNQENDHSNQLHINKYIEMRGSFHYQKPKEMRYSLKRVSPPGIDEDFQRMILYNPPQQQWLCFQYVDQNQQMILKSCLVIRGQQSVIVLKGIVNFYKSIKVKQEGRQFIRSLPGYIYQTNYSTLDNINLNPSHIMPVYYVGQYIKENNANIKFDYYVTKKPILFLSDIIDAIKQKIRTSILKMIINFFQQMIKLGYFLECLSIYNIVFLQKTQNGYEQPQRQRIQKLQKLINQDNEQEFMENISLKIMIDLRHIRRIQNNNLNSVKRICSFLVGLIYINFFLQKHINSVNQFFGQQINTVSSQKIEKQIIKQLQIATNLLKQGKIQLFAFFQIRNLLQVNSQLRWSLQEFLNSFSQKKEISLGKLNQFFNGTIRNIQNLQTKSFGYWSMSKEQLQKLINDFRMIPYIKMILFQQKYLKSIEQKLKMMEINQQNIQDYILYYIQRCIHLQNLIIQSEKYEINNRAYLKLSFDSIFYPKQYDSQKSILQHVQIVDIQTARDILQRFCQSTIKRLLENSHPPKLSRQTKSFGYNLIIAYFYQTQQAQQFNLKMTYLKDYQKLAKKLSNLEKSQKASKQLWNMLEVLFVNKKKYLNSNISTQDSNNSFQHVDKSTQAIVVQQSQMLEQ